MDSRYLKKARQCAEVAEATLESERVAFEEEECFEDDLDQVQAATDATEARVRTVMDQCQWKMVFKFKKCKDEYEDGMLGTALRYPLEIEAFFANQDMG